MIELIARIAGPQNTADSESEDRNAAACLVKDSGYWKSEPCPVFPDALTGLEHIQACMRSARLRQRGPTALQCQVQRRGQTSAQTHRAPSR